MFVICKYKELKCYRKMCPLGPRIEITLKRGYAEFVRRYKGSVVSGILRNIGLIRAEVSQNKVIRERL